MPPFLSESPVAFHISLNVSNLPRSVEFFSRVFGSAPAKHRSDYAKFELQNPPLTLSLEPVDPRERGALNHVGFKFRSSAELVELQRRLELAGLRSEREEGVECCYSKQTKFWLHDPDGTLWEMYVLEGDLEHRGAGQDAAAVMPAASLQTAPAMCSASPGAVEAKRQWSHRLGSPLTVPDDAADLDEIALQGTFNGAGTSPHLGSFLETVFDRLKPGGRLSIHCLTADRHLDEVPALPGPASVVKSVPCLDGLVDRLEAAGFTSIRLMKYGSNACFTAGEAEMRETMLEAFKPAASTEIRVPVVYKGPYAELKLDCGTVLRRAAVTELPENVIAGLLASADADSFTVLQRATSPVACTG